jgi:hypothetical protein
VIDIDAIPLDLPVQRQPVAALYLATVETLPDGRVKVMPHYGGPGRKWFGKPGSALHPQARPYGRRMGSEV